MSDSKIVRNIIKRFRNGSSFSVKVSAGAKRSAFSGLYGENALKLAIAAPAVDGKANREIVKFVASEFQLRLNDVEILTGEKAKLKKIFVALSVEELFPLLLSRLKLE